MSEDFERRVAAGLRRAGDGAPDAGGLAQGARDRLRRRRRTTIAAAAAALVVVAVPVGINVLSGDGADDGAMVATDPGGVESPPEMRTESWRDATVQVPADWGHGSMSAWCAGGDGERPEPVVQRPTTISVLIACSDPASSLGVQFLDARAMTLMSNESVPTEVVDGVDFPAGAWSGYKVVGGTMVQVVAPDEETAVRIYDSIELLDGPDANACPQDLGKAEAGTSTAGDDLSLCRYSDADELESSRLLSTEDGQALLAEIERAPLKTDEPACDPSGQGPPNTVLLQGGSYLGTIAECANGVYLSGTVHELTEGIRELTRMP